MLRAVCRGAPGREKRYANQHGHSGQGRSYTSASIGRLSAKGKRRVVQRVHAESIAANSERALAQSRATVRSVTSIASAISTMLRPPK
jgi:hypothetical protein